MRSMPRRYMAGLSCAIRFNRSPMNTATRPAFLTASHWASMAP